jgi:broad specificity phosphatase PhoE
MGCGASKAPETKKEAYATESPKAAPLPLDKDYTQRVAVVRHGPREDHLNPVAWFTSADGLTNPYDTPITEEGKTVAHNVGKNCPKAFDIVICSPYMRCLQTGCEIAMVHDVPIMFDNSLGEVFDDVYMPKNKQGKKQIRTGKKLLKYLESNYPMVKVLGSKPESLTIYGKHPAFPEDFTEARVRFMDRFEHVLQETAKRQLNPIVVTHADAVVVIFETLTGRECEHVDYCGWFVGERKGTQPVWSEKWNWEVGGHLELEEGDPELCNFEPIINSIKKYKNKRANPYPELKLPSSLAQKYSKEQRDAAMKEFWSPAMTTSFVKRKVEEKEVPLRAPVLLSRGCFLSSPAA